MVVLLEEEQAERESLRKHGSPADTMTFSDRSSLLNKIPFLSGQPDVLQSQSCPVTPRLNQLWFSTTGRSISQIQVQRNTLMTVHIPAARQGDILLDGCTLICIWNIWEPSRPQKVLIYQSEVNSTTINMNISFEIS